jgi:hypothetical protein
MREGKIDGSPSVVQALVYASTVHSLYLWLRYIVWHGRHLSLVECLHHKARSLSLSWQKTLNPYIMSHPEIKMEDAHCPKFSGLN